MTTTQESYDRLCQLRETITWMLSNLHLVDLRHVDCGSKHCVWGWHKIHHNINWPLADTVDYFGTDIAVCAETTGGAFGEWGVFSSSIADSLEEDLVERKRVVEQTIAEREKQLGIAKPTGASICKAIMNGPKLLEDMRV